MKPQKLGVWAHDVAARSLSTGAQLQLAWLKWSRWHWVCVTPAAFLLGCAVHCSSVPLSLVSFWNLPQLKWFVHNWICSESDLVQPSAERRGSIHLDQVTQSFDLVLFSCCAQQGPSFVFLVSPLRHEKAVTCSGPFSGWTSPVPWTFLHCASAKWPSWWFSTVLDPIFQV